MVKKAKKESDVKDCVKKVLADRQRFGYIYQYWPVPAGYGAATLDCIGCYRGVYFAIETKAPGKAPRVRQELCIDEMQRAGATVFVIDSEDTTELEEWLSAIRESQPETQGRRFGIQQARRDADT